MLKYPITYTDFDGNQQTEDLYFNLSQKDLITLGVSNMKVLLEKIVSKKASEKQTIEAFDEFIKLSYGVRSEDGRRFVKTKELGDEFVSSAAYDALFMEIMTGGADKAMSFLMGMLPASVAEDVAKDPSVQGLKFSIPETPSAPPIKNVPLPAPPTPAAKPEDAVPAAYKPANAGNQWQRHGHGPQKRTAEPEKAEEAVAKPLNEMTEVELRAELEKLRKQ